MNCIEPRDKLSGDMFDVEDEVSGKVYFWVTL